MDLLPIRVRALADDAERDTFFRLAAQTFAPELPLDSVANDWRRFVECDPLFDAGTLRGAFRGDTYLGGYTLQTRTLCFGAARLRTGCIGAVVTHPEHRRQGIASALMHDAISYAQEQHWALLLLFGLPNFYGQFGYADIGDIAQHTLDRAAIRALPRSPYMVRPATANDATAMVSLYNRQYGATDGAFAHSDVQHEAMLRFLGSLSAETYLPNTTAPALAPLLATRLDGSPTGYLRFAWGPLQGFGPEIAADDWAATVALLQHHDQLLDSVAHAPATITWLLPTHTLTFQTLTDHLPLRTTIERQPNAGWMARTIDFGALFAALAPALRKRWTQGRDMPTAFSFTIDGQAWQATSDGVEQASAGTQVGSLKLSAQTFVQLLFGYRSAAWAAQQPGLEVPEPLIATLHTLFPTGELWFGSSDGF